MRASHIRAFRRITLARLSRIRTLRRRTRARVSRSLVAAAAVLSLPAAGAVGQPWVVTPGDEQLVGFQSKAPLESFEGTTHTVNGSVVLDPTSIRAKFAIEIRVDMASLDTKLSLRNRHMRENHLHTEQFPEAVFRGARVVEGVGTDLRDGEEHELVVEGDLDLHGVVRTRQLTLALQLEEGRLGVRTEFPVALSDHDIPRPRFLFAKLGKVQQVFVDLAAMPAPVEDGSE